MKVSSTETETSHKKAAASPHMVILDNRQAGTISGVLDVISFHDKEILLKTVDGTITIRGGNLTLTRLDLEKKETDLQGEVDSVTYSRNRGGKEYGKRKKSAEAGWLEKIRSWW